MAWQDKDPDEVIDYQIDWTAELAGDTISTSTWVVPAGLTKGAEANSGSVVSVFLSGGTAGERYTLTNTVTTAAGRTFEAAAVLYVRDAVALTSSALVVTPGDANADSYATVAQAQAYAGNYGGAFTGDQAALEAALRRATAWLDGNFGDRFSGTRVNGRAQPLAWPRSDAYDQAGELVDETTIPREVEAATIEAAIRELASPGSLSPDVTTGQQRVLSRVGELSWSVRGSSSAQAQRPVVLVAEGILAPLIAPKSGRLLRA